MHQMLEQQQPRSTESRLQQLERRYRRVQDSLTNAIASHESLREEPGSSDRALERTRMEVQVLQRQLRQVLDSLDKVEELEDSAS